MKWSFWGTSTEDQAIWFSGKSSAMSSYVNPTSHCNLILMRSNSKVTATTELEKDRCTDWNHCPCLLVCLLTIEFGFSRVVTTLETLLVAKANGPPAHANNLWWFCHHSFPQAPPPTVLFPIGSSLHCSDRTDKEHFATTTEWTVHGIFFKTECWWPLTQLYSFAGNQEVYAVSFATAAITSALSQQILFA